MTKEEATKLAAEKCGIPVEVLIEYFAEHEAEWEEEKRLLKDLGTIPLSDFTESPEDGKGTCVHNKCRKKSVRGYVLCWKHLCEWWDRFGWPE